jgi:phage terminase small subunit
MPRRSAAALAAMYGAKPVKFNAPEPSKYLTENAKEIWRQVANSLPPNWFDDYNLGLLEQYCRTLEQLRILGKDIVDKNTSKELAHKLSVRSSKLTRDLCMLATKMRLTQQSNYDKRKSRNTKIVALKPWQKNVKKETEEES